MLSRAIYSVISPEGCASILWRDASYAPDAAKALNLTADALLKLDVIDEIIEEPAEGAHTGVHKTAENVKNSIIKNLNLLGNLDVEELLKNRSSKYSNMGKYNDINKG